MTKQK